MKTLYHLLAALFLLASHSAHAEQAIVTGSKTGTYFPIGSDIVSTIATKNIPLTVKSTSGTIENINLLGKDSSNILGLVQSDVLGFMQRSTEKSSVEAVKHLRIVLPLYQEEVHILARHNIKTLQDLHGKTVAVGQIGSGSWLTAINLFALTGIKPAKLLRIPAEEGVVSVLRERADAAIFVGGKPVKLFSNLANLSAHPQYARMLRDVHLLPLDDDRLTREYSKAAFLPMDYKFVSQTIPTIAVSALLVSYDDASNSQPQRCETIRTISQSITQNLASLRTNGHPKWSQIDLSAYPSNWQIDACAYQSNGGSALEQELLRVLKAY